MEKEKKHRQGWTQEDIKFLKKNYGKVDNEILCKKLGKSIGTIRQYASRHDIKFGCYWTEKEVEYLLNQVGKKPIVDIARRLGRSRQSVKDKCAREGCGSFLENCYGKLHLREIARLVGRDKKTIAVTWVKKGLQFDKVGKYLLVDEEVLFDFMQEHPELWKATECEKWYFNSYEWFQNKRKKDFDKMVKERWENVNERKLCSN